MDENRYLSLPNHINVICVRDQLDLKVLNAIVGKPLIGIAVECSQQVLPFDKERLCLLTLSDESTTYLVDMLALANDPALDQILTTIVSQESSTILGFSFKDLQQTFETHLPGMSFYKHFANFLYV